MKRLLSLSIEKQFRFEVLKRHIAIIGFIIFVYPGKNIIRSIK